MCQMRAFGVLSQRSSTLVLSSVMCDNMCKAGPMNLDIWGFITGWLQDLGHSYDL